MFQKTYFITGVCGVGKSAIIPYLRQLLSDEQYDVRDFDERGVPDGADNAWRKQEVVKWLEVAGQNNKITVICGFVKDTDFPAEASAELILLDADSETIRKRLEGRYSKNGVFDDTQKVIGKPVNEFIESNVYYCEVMRKEFKGAKVINTTNLSPEQVAQEVAVLLDL